MLEGDTQSCDVGGDACRGVVAVGYDYDFEMKVHVGVSGVDYVQ